MPPTAPRLPASGTRPLRVLFVTTTFPDTAGSSRGVFIRRLGELLRQQGHEVRVLAPRVLPGSPQHETIHGMQVYRFPMLSKGRLLESYQRVPVKQMLTFMLTGTLWTLAHAVVWGADLIHGHWIVPTGAIAAGVGRITGLPVVTSGHGTDLHVWAHRRGVREILRWTLCRSDAVTVNSTALKCVATSVAPNAVEPRLVHENGVDIDRFSPVHRSEALRRQWWPNPGCVVLWVANLVPVKQPEIALRALAALPSSCNAHLLMVGRGRLDEELRRLADRLGIADRVRLVGEVRHEDLHPYFASADIFLLPSQNEGLGIVIMEAMASGLPVVASAVGGIPDLVRDGETGFLCNPQNETDFAAALRHLLDDAELRRQMARRSRERAERDLGEQIQLGRVLDAYRQITSRHLG